MPRTLSARIQDHFARLTDTPGEVRVVADAHLSLCGTSFLVVASVTSLADMFIEAKIAPAQPWILGAGGSRRFAASCSQTWPTCVSAGHHTAGRPGRRGEA
jgi:hypothetical protein